MYVVALIQGPVPGPPKYTRKPFWGSGRLFCLVFPKGPKYLYGTKYAFSSSNFPYGLGNYSPYGYLGPFGFVEDDSRL